MQQHSLIGLRNLTNVTDLHRLPALDVPQGVITSRWLGGSAATASAMIERVSEDSSHSSGWPLQLTGLVAQCPSYGELLSRNRSESTARSSPAISDDSAENGTVRPSRSARVFALLVRMRNIQVLSEDRPSNRLMPRNTPSHASWATSSATVRSVTKMPASRIMPAWYCSTSVMNADSSPRRSAAMSIISSSVAVGSAAPVLSESYSGVTIGGSSLGAGRSCRPGRTVHREHSRPMPWGPASAMIWPVRAGTARRLRRFQCQRDEMRFGGDPWAMVTEPGDADTAGEKM